MCNLINSCSSSDCHPSAADTHRKVRASTLFVAYSLHVSIVGFCTLRQKRIRGGSTYAERNSGPLQRHLLLMRTPPLSQCHAWLGATQFSAACQTHTGVHIELDGVKQAGREGAMKDGGWEGGSKRGSEEAMMWGSV